VEPNPFLGVVFHLIGGFAAGSFYAPLKKVRSWTWETYWLVMGVAAWLVTPWIVAGITTRDLLRVLSESPPKALVWSYVFGVLWGIGGLTYGLTMRYLGMALGVAVALGFCAAFGTLMPPLFTGRFTELLASPAGRTILVGVVVSLAGIAICGLAGRRKENELSGAEAKEGVAEFALGKGFLMATVSGILSACFAYGVAAAKPIGELAVQMGTKALYANNAGLVVILMGGLTTNMIWCLRLNRRNSTFSDYRTGPLLNYVLCALSGVIWYYQFFFYGMGMTKMGKRYDFSSWSLHMAFIIVFANLWGLYFKEWKGASRGTRAMVWVGLTVLVLSTVVIGYANRMGAK
jgi:L-rhamnose-H+ transport protein